MVGRAVDRCSPRSSRRSATCCSRSAGLSPRRGASATSPSRVRGRRDRRHGRAGRRRPHRDRAGPVRDRPADAGEILLDGEPVAFARPVRGDAGRHRLRPGGPPPGRPRPRLLDRRERVAADPAAAVPAGCRARLGRSGRWPAATPTQLQRPDDRRRPAGARRCPAATSRRSSSPSGWRPTRGSSSSTSRRAASTSAPRPRSTG